MPSPAPVLSPAPAPSPAPEPSPAVLVAAAVLPAAVATAGPWIPVGAQDAGIKGEKCGPEHVTEDEVRQAFKQGMHLGYYQANGALPFLHLACEGCKLFLGTRDVTLIGARFRWQSY